MTRFDFLFAGKIWFAFFGEGRDAFAVVVRIAELALEIAFEIELLLEPREPALAHRHLDRRIAACRSDRKTLGELFRFCLQLVVLHAAPDEAPRFRLFGGERFAGQREA